MYSICCSLPLIDDFVTDIQNRLSSAPLSSTFKLAIKDKLYHGGSGYTLSSQLSSLRLSCHGGISVRAVESMRST